MCTLRNFLWLYLVDMNKIQLPLNIIGLDMDIICIRSNPDLLTPLIVVQRELSLYLIAPQIREIK